MSLKSIVHYGLNFIQKNSPYILTGLGCAGIVTTAVMTGKAAVKAHRTITDHDDLFTCKLSNEELENRSEVVGVGSPHYYESTMKEKILLTWKYFIPPALMGATSVACIIGAQSVSAKRHAALASLYTLTDQTLKDYQEKVIEQIGKNKAKKIEDEIAQDILDANPVTKHKIIRTSHGDTLCYDVYSGRYFTHDIEKLRRIQNDFNHDLMGSMWLPLNDLYYMMGLEQVKMGEDLGWCVDDLLEFKFTSKLTDDGQPCLVVDYELTTKYLKTNSWGGL